MHDGDSSPEGWSTRDKFAAVVESASLNEHELPEYCRKKGIYTEQIEQWRRACENANDWVLNFILNECVLSEKIEAVSGFSDYLMGDK